MTTLRQTSARADTRADRQAEHGFTLIEMLVALAIFALAALALARVNAMTMRAAADTRLAGLAALTARDLAVELLTDPAPPAPGEASGHFVNGGINWQWRRQVSRPGDRPLLRIDLEVTSPDARTRYPLTLVRGLE